MQSLNETLLAIAANYSSKEEFKKKNLPKYLITKNKGLLNRAFPTKYESPKTISGIYYLYEGTQIVYIGYSFTDCMEGISTMKDTMICHRYRIRPIYSASDIKVIHEYLTQFHKPKHNTNVVPNMLSLMIPSSTLRKVWGKAIVGQFDLRN